MTNEKINTYSDLVQGLKAVDILREFPEVIPMEETSGAPSSSGSNDANDESIFKGYDEEQIRLMEENCIVLDYDDIPVGAATKKVCHIMDNIDRGLLHRAFSVFLFDSQDRLLLQQRADEKITFPSMWTNTCCSHPLCVPGELGSDLDAAVRGAQSAAQRKLEQELGIAARFVPVDGFKFLTRIHYMAPSNGIWGEHEIDYILITRADPVVTPNPNEVKDIKYVTAAELKAMFEDSSLTFTPWFKLICESYLFKWWANLGKLDQFRSNGIERML
ncbi:unnamed protein product [Kuraishia capsulata CBS 1993]|uniref:Isopentenyl-diphosphate Delta-isomerase n=1 Tax=Kuraishia capsulata CBS 1993 TaxID=1382522 RepID=W6MU75_9ASCO|nr:uncharacterized protein KUCA_T00004918001 [Kuraishia capsulata CBS 1993]CDK28932.1 unnamed protein product [Kuraishia capsulata CBS 1993]